MEWTDPAVAEFVERGMVARIATVSRNGRPHVNPIYYVASGGALHLGTATYTLAARNVDANPAVQLLLDIEAEPADRRLLRVTGTGRVRTDQPTLDAYRRAVARKYVVTLRGLWNLLVHPRQWGPMRRHLGGGEGCVIEVTPDSVEMTSVALPVGT